MQYILLASIVSLIIFTQPRYAVARQSTDGQNPDAIAPVVKSGELAQPAANLLISGKNILQQGVNEGNLDAMYAARATFERALADKSLSDLEPLLHRPHRLPHRQLSVGAKQ